MSCWELGSSAPPYIVVVFAATMITTVVATYHQYSRPEYDVDIHEAVAFKWIPLSIFLWVFFGLSSVLLFFTILNLFCGSLPINTFFHSVIKISMFFCCICFWYSSFEFVKKYTEELSEREIENNLIIEENEE